MEKKEIGSMWSVIKGAFKESINAEKNYPGGTANLFFGLLIFLIVISNCLVGSLEIICKMLNPKFDVGLPWYVISFMFIFFIGYSIYCVDKLLKIQSKITKK